MRCTEYFATSLFVSLNDNSENGSAESATSLVGVYCVKGLTFGEGLDVNESFFAGDFAGNQSPVLHREVVELCGRA